MREFGSKRTVYGVASHRFEHAGDHTTVERAAIGRPDNGSGPSLFGGMYRSNLEGRPECTEMEKDAPGRRNHAYSPFRPCE